MLTLWCITNSSQLGGKVKAAMCVKAAYTPKETSRFPTNTADAQMFSILFLFFFSVSFHVLLCLLETKSFFLKLHFPYMQGFYKKVNNSYINI